MTRLILISVAFILCTVAFSVNLTPTVIFQDGIETDTMITQQLLRIGDADINVAFNLQRFGFDIGYRTPYLMRAITIHAGVLHRWTDLNKQFAPAFAIGLSIQF